LHYVSDPSGTHLVSSFLYLGSSAADGTLSVGKENKYYAARLNYLSKSQTEELYGRHQADLFNSDSMLIHDVDMNIRLVCTGIILSIGTCRRSQTTHKNHCRYKFCHPDRIDAHHLLAHAIILGMKLKAHYPVIHTQIKIEFWGPAGIDR
jgi:hypothetical protein